MAETVVTAKTATGLPAVYSAVAVISEAVASLPLGIYQDGEEVPGHQVAQLLQNPNSWQTAFEFIEYLTRSALLTGNGFAWLVGDALEPLHPNQVAVERLMTPVEGVRYRYQISDDWGNLSYRAPGQILHLRAPGDDLFIGQSPITVCREAVGLGLDQQKHGANTFKNGARPGGVLEYEKFLNDGKAEKIKDSWNEQYQGTENDGKTAILEGGVKFKPVAVTNHDAEWLASREFSVKEIARMFRMPSYFLNDRSGNDYSNVTEARRSLLTQCLLPWLRRWCGVIKRDLMLPAGVTAEFNTREYLRGDTTERYAAYQVGLSAGFLTVDEVRAAESLPPLPKGTPAPQGEQDVNNG